MATPSKIEASHFYEKFFVDPPQPTKDSHLYCTTDGFLVKWSGTTPLPAVGTEIRILLNHIGPGTVTGYFESCGFIGVMVTPSKPPDWLLQQCREHRSDAPDWLRQGIVCVFGAEMTLL